MNLTYSNFILYFDHMVRWVNFRMLQTNTDVIRTLNNNNNGSHIDQIQWNSFEILKFIPKDYDSIVIIISVQREK